MDDLRYSTMGSKLKMTKVSEKRYGIVPFSFLLSNSRAWCILKGNLCAHLIQRAWFLQLGSTLKWWNCMIFALLTRSVMWCSGALGYVDSKSKFINVTPISKVSCLKSCVVNPHPTPTFSNPIVHRFVSRQESKGFLKSSGHITNLYSGILSLHSCLNTGLVPKLREWSFAPATELSRLLPAI